MFPLKCEQISSEGRDEENHKDLIDELPVGILAFDTKGNITVVNKFILELLGSPSAAYTKQFNLLTFPPLVESGISASIQEAIATGKTTVIETPYHSKWDKEIFVRFKTIPRMKEEGQVTGCYAVVEDATVIKKTSSELEQKKRQEHLYSYISSRFINTSFTDIDNNINQALKEIAKFAGAERSSIFLSTDDPSFVVKTHEWHAKGIRSQIEINQHFPMPKLLKKFNKFESICVPDTQQLSDNNSTVRKALLEFGILSVIVVPLSCKGNFSGFISLDCQTHKKEWSESTFYLVKLMGEMIINVLERKNTEGLLVKKEEDYEQVVNSIDTIIWKADVCGDEKLINTYISPAVDKMLGLTNDTIGNDWGKYLSCIHLGDVQNVLDAIRLTTHNPGNNVNQDYRLIKGNGDIFWVNSSTISHVQLDGTVKIFGTITDITWRKHAEEELIRSERKYRSLVEQSTDAIFINRLDGQILDVNDKACQMLGYTKEQFRNMSVVDLQTPEERELGTKVMDLLKIKKSLHGETKYLTANGNVINVEINAAILEGYQDLAQAVVRDITERKRAEESLLHAKLIAEAASRTKNDFLVNMSHELRTPLNSIIGFSDAMLEGLSGELDPKQCHYLQNISMSGKHLLNLINEILDISKVEAGKMTLSPEVINAGFLIAEMASTIQPLTTKKKITVNVWKDSAADILFMADAPKVKQILYNLLGNAIKFTPSGGEINIHASLKGNMVRVSVIDNGIGISAEDQKKLFTPFTQLDNFVSKQHEGTGLGLALVKELVELHGGRVWVESEAGKGSNFTFELPACNWA